ncbi:uncharacterized protein METZ01_LOCUS368602, partial [marine metagenome]
VVNTAFSILYGRSLQISFVLLIGYSPPVNILFNLNVVNGGSTFNTHFTISPINAIILNNHIGAVLILLEDKVFWIVIDHFFVEYHG